MLSHEFAVTHIELIGQDSMELCKFTNVVNNLVSGLTSNCIVNARSSGPATSRMLRFLQCSVGDEEGQDVIQYRL